MNETTPFQPLIRLHMLLFTTTALPGLGDNLQYKKRNTFGKWTW